MRATLLLVLLTVSFIAASPHRRLSPLDTVKNAIKVQILPLAKAKASEVMTCIKGKAVAALKGLVLGKVQAIFGRRRLGLKEMAVKLACKVGKAPALSFCKSTLVPGVLKTLESKIKAMLKSHKAPTSAVGPSIECVKITALKTCDEAATKVCG
jgi:hypothetical protein